MVLEYTGVIFSRPGENGIIPYIGTLWATEVDKTITNCKFWVSPSTSCLLSVMKILGYSCLEILATLTKLPQLAISPSLFKNPLNLGNELGKLRDELSMIIRSKLGLIPTLADLYTQTGVVLVGIGFSLTNQEIEYIHKETYPNMSLLDLMCISFSTPGIYKPYKLGSDLWIDGSIMEVFSPSSIELKEGNILAITSKSCKINYHNKDPINQVKDMMRTISEGILNVCVSEKYPGMTMINIHSDEYADNYIKLRNGWDCYHNTIKEEIPSANGGDGGDVIIHSSQSIAEMQN
jgi:hypothetical protein